MRPWSPFTRPSKPALPSPGETTWQGPWSALAAGLCKRAAPDKFVGAVPWGSGGWLISHISLCFKEMQIQTNGVFLLENAILSFDY